MRLRLLIVAVLAGGTLLAGAAPAAASECVLWDEYPFEPIALVQYVAENCLPLD